MIIDGFFEDLAKAKKGEAIVLEVLRNTHSDTYTFKDVSGDKEYYHKGDIECEDHDWLLEYYIDVKDDSCIANTGNLLAEHRVWYYDNGWQKGFMQNSEYDYVAYLSQQDQKIYMLDFAAWKKHYRAVYKKRLQIRHGYKQTTDAYLMPLSDARRLGIVVAEIDYENKDGAYVPVNVDGIFALVS